MKLIMSDIEKKKHLKKHQLSQKFKPLKNSKFNNLVYKMYTESYKLPCHFVIFQFLSHMEVETAHGSNK